MGQMKILSLVLVGALLPQAGCNNPTPRERVPQAAQAVPQLTPARTDEPVYSFAPGQFGPELRIRSTFTAPADTALHLANCNGAFSWRLQKVSGQDWADAWSPAMDACLSAPILIPPSGTHTGTHLVRPGAGARLLAPSGENELDEGTYRLVWDGLSRAKGGAVPLASRLSNTFKVGPPCALRGRAVQWIGDYCLFREQTDDLVAAGDCIAEEQTRAAGMEECRVATRYKSELCKLHLSAGIRPGTLAECVNDAGFSGNIVRSDGSP